MVSNYTQNSVSRQNLPKIQALGKKTKQLSTYPERPLIIHGSIRVSKLPYEHPLKPAFQDGRDSKPLQGELRDRGQRG